MTYTFKLSRRLAVSRAIALLTLLLTACADDSTAPDATSNGSSDISHALQVSPGLVTIETGQQVQFRGHTREPQQTRRSVRRGREAVAVTWQATGGTIQSDGLFFSKTAGTFKVIGRGRGRNQTDTSVVIVIPPPTNLVRIAVAPDPVTLDPGMSRTFTATGYLNDGSASAVGVTWKATGGDVDPAGVYLAGSAAGSYEVIATNTTGTLADTATVTIDPPAPSAPTLASVILSPTGVSLALGGSKQFHAYGRTSAGDSVAIVPSYSATGGSITPDGLFAGGMTAGSYRVIAASNGLADTAAVTLTQALGAGGSGSVGVPFGASQLLTDGTGTAPFTMSLDGYNASTIVSRIADARSKHFHLLMNMTGGSHDLYLSNGVFDMTKWLAKMRSYDTPAIQAAVAAGVSDGTIVGNSVMDEPANISWGPAGTMTKARVDQMCSSAKAIFPTLPVGVVHTPNIFQPEKSYYVCEFTMAQYRWSHTDGDVELMRDQALAMARRDHMSVAFSLNVLHGGVPSTTCTKYAGDNTAGTLCPMTAAQIREYGLVLGSAGCALNMWRYDAEYYARSDNQSAFRTVADSLAKVPRKGCGRP
jgi:hypothetical protein